MNKTDDSKVIHSREVAFHDEWAESEDVNNIDVFLEFESITAVENKYIVSKMQDIKGKKLLDVGCGLGESSVYFALKGAQVTATDISPSMIETAGKLAARYNAKLDLIVSPAEHLSFEDETFDIIYTANLLHHVQEHERQPLIDKLYKLLKKDGMFYSWDPVAYNPVINVYRRIANKVRSDDEMPLKFDILKKFKNFRQVEHKEFWLFTLVLFLKYYLINRFDPNKVRYWKRIHQETESTIGWWFNILLKLDNLLLKIPGINRLSWGIVISARK